MGSSIQQFMAMGAVVLFSMLVLMFMSSANIQTESTYLNEGVISSTGLAQSLLEEIRLKKFDEAAVAGTIDSVSQLSETLYLGPDSGEDTDSKFDDVDDYHNYLRIDTAPQLGSCTLTVSVAYVDILKPDSVVTNRTFLKKIDINVSNAFLQGGSLNLNSIVTY